MTHWHHVIPADCAGMRRAVPRAMPNTNSVVLKAHGSDAAGPYVTMLLSHTVTCPSCGREAVLVVNRGKTVCVACDVQVCKR